MNKIIIKSLLYFLILLFSNCLNSQISKSDSITKQIINTKINGFYKYSIEENKDQINNDFINLNRVYPFMNFYMKEEAYEFYRLILNSKIISKEQKYTFFISNFSQLSSDQISQIRRYLELNISVKDKYYHHIVSIYNLTSQVDYLKSNLREDFFTRLNKSNKIGDLDKKEISELKNISVLVNLEYYPEDLFLKEINNLYLVYKKNKELEYFQFYILINSIAILNSKKSITETLHMLNEMQESSIAPYQDVIHLGYPYYYFQICIAPKMKDIFLKDSIYNDKQLMIRKSEIINMIQNDDNFWKEYVKIE